MAHVGGGRVPVEHRLLGIDKRTIPYAAVALAVFVLWTIVMPWINERVGWDDPIQAGDRIVLTNNGVTFAPATGWELLSGLRTTDDANQTSTASTVVTNGGATFYVQRGEWDGTPRALLDQITKITTTEAGDDGFSLSSKPTSFQTASGADGVLQAFRSQRVEGLIAALVFDGVGVQVQVVGSPEQLDRHSREIGTMLASIRQEAQR